MNNDVQILTEFKDAIQGKPWYERGLGVPVNEEVRVQLLEAADMRITIRPFFVRLVENGHTDKEAVAMLKRVARGF